MFQGIFVYSHHLEQLFVPSSFDNNRRLFDFGQSEITVLFPFGTVS